MDRCDKIVGLLFMSRDMAHRAHLKAKGQGAYSAHMALGEFYESIADLADDFAEAYQGKYGICDIAEIDFKGDVSKPLDMIQTHLTMYENLEKSIDDRFLQNISDSIIALYYKTIYKLTNLQ